MLEDVSLVEFMYVVFIAWAPGGVIVGDSSLYWCGPAFNVMRDVNCSSAIASHCLLIRLHEGSECLLRIRVTLVFSE